MKNFLMLIFAIGAVSFMGKPAAGKAPNIVFILADDLGYGDVHCLNPAHGKIATPQMDRLATQGMVFTDAHSGSSVCTPTRYGILTGRYAWRTRLQSFVLRPYDPPLIAADRLTVPKLLASRGYQTACIGKWHLGWNWPRDGQKVLFDHPIADGPTTRGFGYYFGTDVPNYPPYGFIKNDRLVAQPTDWFKGDRKMVLGTPGPIVPGWKFDQILPRLTEQAVQYISERAADKKPFFLYFALTSPHEPIAPSAAFRGKSGISPLADFIMETDWALGQVLAALAEAWAGRRYVGAFCLRQRPCRLQRPQDSFGCRSLAQSAIPRLQGRHLGRRPPHSFSGPLAGCRQGGRNLRSACLFNGRDGHLRRIGRRQTSRRRRRRQRQPAADPQGLHNGTAARGGGSPFLQRQVLDSEGKVEA